MSRECSRSTLATDARTSSPCWWPNSSFTCLKSSMSSIINPSVPPKRRVGPGPRGGPAEAAAALELAVERAVELPHVRQPGELIRDGLALDGLVQVGVLDRHRR